MSAAGARGAGLAAYAAYFEALRPETVADLYGLARPDLRFRDPFNDVVGVEAVERIFRHMFRSLDDPGFAITDRALGEAAGYLRWTMTFGLRGRRYHIDGVAEIDVDHDGRIAGHVDHWDAASQLYGRLPWIGWPFRFLRRRLAG